MLSGGFYRLKKVIANNRQNSKKMLTMFIVGLTVLQPYRTACSGSRFAIRRFGVPVNLSSIYVSKFHTSMHTWNIIGITFVNIYMWSFGSTHFELNVILSVFTNFMVFLLNICHLLSYIIKRRGGMLTLYYWTSILCSIAYGINRTFAACIGVEFLAFFVCGLQFAGIQIVLFQAIFLAITKPITNFDVDYWLIPSEIFITTIISAISFFLWTTSFAKTQVCKIFSFSKRRQIDQGSEIGINDFGVAKMNSTTVNLGDKTDDLKTSKITSFQFKQNADSNSNSFEESDKNESNSSSVTFTEPSNLQINSKEFVNAKKLSKISTIFKSIIRAKSPILMSGFGASLVFGFYPSVAPYKLTTLEIAHIIDLTVLVSGAVSATIISLLCLLGLGPNKKWKGNDYFWNYFHYLIIPYLLIIICFLISMHYPNSGFSKAVRSPIILAFLTDRFAGVGLQEDRKNGTVSSLNTMFSYSLVFVSIFWGSGYIKIYNKYEQDLKNWPTKDTTGFFWIKSIFFWFWKSFEGGSSNFKNMLTTDLMRDINSVVEP
ncbi:Tpr-like protein [Theileria parva strain Muguga]|uniref:Uncharacterized protein n=1 Tax=Theileria parva TaxID=5875 RepID=Q4N480_THEPA|nr:Tpr-like protein [Theileria parva strain Muguga]EAN33043.1 Tpr-like protein [Theileria parva strain Muguga]|eukprot:XP_765326.1 hypothetical protein [Theileria parva strain Muguga]